MISPHQKSRNNARSPLYFAVARVHSRPWMITFRRGHTPAIPSASDRVSPVQLQTSLRLLGCEATHLW